MKGKGKRILSMLLSCCMVCSMGSFYPASAAEGSTQEDLIRYEKDYEDGNPGVWEGAEASIIEDPDNPGNHVLQLKNFEAGATGRNFGREASAPAIADGTLSMKVKGISTSATFYRMGFIYRAEDVASEANQLTESGGWFICNEGSYNTGYPKYAALEERGGIPTNEWVDVKIQFVGEEVEISVNNVRYGKVSIAGQSTNAGTFGIRNANGATFLLDDVVFTNELLDMGEEYQEPEIDTGRLEVSEDYASDPADWTGNPTVSDGTLQVTVPAGGVAVNNNAEMQKMGIGMNTYRVITDDQGRFGVAFNYVDDTDYNAVYSNQSGEYRIKSVKSGLDQVIASDSLVLEPNTEYEIKIENIEGSYKFYIDGVLVQEGTVEGLSQANGTVGLYNPTDAQAQMSILGCDVYEMYYYFNDFSDPENLGGWEGNATVNHVENGDLNGDGELSIDMRAVTNAVATDTPIIRDGIYEFDVKSTATNSANIGRVGFLFRSRDQAVYQGLFYDTGNSWVWLNGAAYGSFNGNFELKDGQGYHVRMEVEGNNVKLYVDGELIGYGAYNLTSRQGHFGLRKQYDNSNIRLDNLKVQETVSVKPKDKEDIPVTIRSEQMSVTMDENFPRVLGYEMNSKTMPGNPEKVYGIRVNGSVYYPIVNCEKTAEDTLLYTLNFSTLGVTLKIQYTVDEHQLKMNVTDIVETGDTLVKDIQFDNDALVSTNPSDTASSMATVLVGGGHSSVSEEIHDTLDDATEGQSSQTYGMIATNGLAATINNSAVETNSRLNVTVSETDSGKIAAMGNGSFTYRKVDDRTEELPWAIVDICEDYNNDGDVNWQDAAANYKNIRDEVYGVEQMKDNMMYIAMNFASQVQEPFLKTLDTGKTLYNYTDGFGQMIMHKGYQAEGHDDSHGDYGGHIGVRQGGVEDFNYIIEEGKKYNLKFGIHINVNEHNPDAFNFDTDPIYHPLSANWGWVDQAYWVDEMEDITSGNRDARLDELKEDLPDLNFVYVDIYASAGWEADDLTKALNSRGYIVGTEFAGPLEQGAAFTHWGNDIHYPNTGNESTVMRYFKNDLDIFVSNALTKGNKFPGVATWGANSMKEAVETFYNHVLPTKFMQHYDVLDIEDTYVTFNNGLKTEKFGTGNPGDENNLVVMTKNGKKIAEWTWEKSGTQEVTGETTLLIPWDPDTEDKLYHWNPAGGTTTWDVPESWTAAGIASADLYKLSADDKELIGTVEIQDGKIELTAEAGVGYVLYPTGDQAPIVAGDFGQGSPVANPGFDTTDLSDWDITNNNTTTTVDMNEKYETYLSIKGQAADASAEVSQTMQGLTPGTTNTVYLFADISDGSRLDMTVDVDGKQVTHSAEATDVVYHGQSKYEGSSYQKVKVTFDVPEGVTEAKLTLNASIAQNGGYINVDDVRVWENLNRTPQITDPGYEDYVIYEDFENVEQGYGVLELAYASGIYTHLAEYREEENQYVDYVVDGNFSLKTNELGAYVGQVLRTNPNQAKMEANTTYDISFAYQTGVEGRHHMEVRNSQGDVVYRYDFMPTELEEGSHSLANREVNGVFTTGDSDDYYLAIYKDSDNMAYPESPEEGSYMERIYLSLDNLIVKESASLADLEQKVAEAKEIDGSGYTEESFAALQQAIIDAEEVLALEDPTAEQISTAYQNLVNAIQNLKEIVDKTTLEQLYKANENRNEDTYSAGSWATFQTAMENAKAVLDNADATKAEINEATTALQSAVDGLVNISTLEYVLGIANGHVTAGDVDKLIPTAQEQFYKALASAQGIYDDPNATQEQVDSAWKMLMTVIQALGFVPGDKTELATLVESMKTVDLDAYEDGAEKDAFKEALAEAEALLKDEDAMELDIEAAIEALEDAFAALKPLPEVGDKTELKKAIDVAEGHDLSLYVDDANKESFLEILAEAKDMYDNNDTASQAEIDAMTKKLLDATANLRLRADKETLNKWLEALKGLDLSQYTEASAAAVRAAIANAEALAAQDLGNDQQALIQAAIAQMQNAYNGLELSAQEPDPSDPGDNSSSSGKPATDDVPTTGDSLPLIALSTLGVAAAGAWLLIRKKRSI